MGSCKWRTTYGVAVCSAIALLEATTAMVVFCKLILKSSFLVMIALVLIEINFTIPTQILFSTNMVISIVGTVILIMKTIFVFLILVGLSLGKLQLLRVFLWPASICFMLDCFLELFSIIYTMLYQPYDNYSPANPGISIVIALALLLLDGILSLLINIYYHNVTSGKSYQSTASGNELGPSGFLIMVD